MATTKTGTFNLILWTELASQSSRRQGDNEIDHMTSVIFLAFITLRASLRATSNAFELESEQVRQSTGDKTNNGQARVLFGFQMAVAMSYSSRARLLYALIGTHRKTALSSQRSNRLV